MKKDEPKKLIVDEFNFFLKKIKAKPNPSEILFYFSALYGVVNRVYNIEYDIRFLYLHDVLTSVYNAFLNAVNTSKAGAAPSLIQEKHFKRLTELLSELNVCIKNDFEGVHSIYEKLIELKYTTTGNGYYLLERGKIKL